MTADLLDNRLQALDPAAGFVGRRDPEVVLGSILGANPAPSPSAPRSGRRSTRIALVAAAALTLVASPVLNGHNSAYAGWTAYPAALSTGQASTVARQCQNWTRTSITRAPTQVVLSERRGDIGLALLTGPQGLVVTCTQHLGSGEPSGGLSEAHLARYLGPDQIVSDGGSGFTKDDGEPIFRVVSGRVGADVSGVVVHTAQQGDVIATVDNGYFTAWWPGPPDPQDFTPTAGLPMDFTFTAQLRDGTTKNFDRTATL